MDAAALGRARDYALSGGGSGYITRGGRLVLSWGDPRRRYDLKSTTKSFGATALGAAILEGKVRIEDRAVDLHPSFGVPPESNRASGWIERVTLLHLATHTAGFEKPGGTTKLLFEPGTRWLYSDGGPNWLAECLTLAWRLDLRDVLFERVLTPIGVTPEDLTWRENAYRDRAIDGIPRREFGSGIHANVNAMARVGLLYLRRGRWRDRRILPESFVDQASRPIPTVVGLPEEAPDYGNASDHHGLLWWNNADGTLDRVPRDAYWSWGLHESLILVIPSLEIVAARAGDSWKRAGAGHYDVLRGFFEPIAASVRPLEWAPADTIVRRAPGSDNWPMTWGDDGHLYTAYGDGWGFDPRVPDKLSLGLARVEGDAEDFRGVNLRSASIEQVGDGERGAKASGALMVGGVLYLWVRNAGNSRLAWSRDRGATWTWADWRFTESFGCPTFLNYGMNYEGARDCFVYTYAFDADSAYRPADRFVLARAPKERLAERGAWEFFTGLDPGGRPGWSADPARSGAVLARPGRCYRSGVSFNPARGRYLWAQILPEKGLAILEAPEPWGPWTTLFEADPWDVDPGESASFPVKWMSADGRTVHLVFSGGDGFCVRRATLRPIAPP
jgi:CubicO group peptidase (beta-lactamase class C family)